MSAPFFKSEITSFSSTAFAQSPTSTNFGRSKITFTEHRHCSVSDTVIPAGQRLPSPPPSQQVLNTPELLDTIIVFLKSGVTQDPSDIQHTPRSKQWKSILVPLVTLNSVFFRAVMEVIWEDMDSLSPFLELLKPPGDPDWMVFSLSKGIPAESWERFQIYSARTKSLRLDSTNMLPCWAMYITLSRSRPLAMFPNLKELTLTSAHCGLALAIVASSLSTLERVFVMLDAEGDFVDAQTVLAVIVTLSESPACLSSLHLTNAANKLVIDNICHISTLRHLTLHIAMDEDVLLDRLNSLRLESLKLDVEPFQLGDHSLQPTSLATLNRLISLRSLPTLQHLEVVGDCRSQLEVASALGPSSLTKLNLEIIYDDASTNNISFAPFILAVYLGRSQQLESLSVTGVLVPAQNFSRGVANSGRVPDWTPEFLLHLSRSSALEGIDVQNGLFPCPSIVVDVLRLLPNLQQLKSFKFIPWVAPLMETLCVMPQLDDLQDIASNNSALVTLSIPFDAQSICTSFPSISSLHGLRSLTLRPYPDLRLSALPLNTQLRLAMFIHTLFPFVRSLTCDYTSGSAQWSDWHTIEMMVCTYQHVYTRAIHQAQRQIDQAVYVHPM
ncbi:hypothetical protein NMY22_g107 [Coprinellus aureogranulatus]|nr:hypothetical protein NMY22_g107 [Coprinellus aureogranulatus]